jgi:hypothetical protein
MWLAPQWPRPQPAAPARVPSCCLLLALRLPRWTPSNRSPRPSRRHRNRLAPARPERPGPTIPPRQRAARRPQPPTTAARRYRPTTSAPCSPCRAKRLGLVLKGPAQIRCRCQRPRPVRCLRPTPLPISSSSASLRRPCFRHRRFPSAREIIQIDPATPAARRQRAGRLLHERRGQSRAQSHWRRPCPVQ